MYNPATGEIRLGSFDNLTLGHGHEGLADHLGCRYNKAERESSSKKKILSTIATSPLPSPVPCLTRCRARKSK